MKHRGFNSQRIISFKGTNENDVHKVIKNINANKTCQSDLFGM